MISLLVHAVLSLTFTPDAGEWPLEPRPDVVADFSPPASEYGAGHRGVDLAGRPGQPVRAAARGVVGFAGTVAGRGVVVVVHGDTRTTYEPVAATVEVGDRVSAGQTVGRLGLFGSHCWPRACLHWGLLQGTTYLDPLSLVGAGPVRLLPLNPPLGALGAPPVAAGVGGVMPWDAPAGRPVAVGPW